ncbi:MAG: hypothetical protein V7776_11865 [Halopseudomonas aestusnigri]
MFRYGVAAVFMASAFVLSPYVISDPVLHVLVQIPLLLLSGGLLASRVTISKDIAYVFLIIALVTLIYWMLPRSIDAALSSPWHNAGKFVSLPLLAGAPLVLSWKHLHPVLRGFLKANAISMLGIFAFLYIHAPIRICNSYLITDQQNLGYGFFYVAISLSNYWGWSLVFGSPQRVSHDDTLQSIERVKHDL